MSSFRTYEESYETDILKNEQEESIVFQIQGKDVFQNVLQRFEIVIVDVWANFCSPCKLLAPHYEKLALQWKDFFQRKQVIFLKDCIDDEDIESIHGNKIKAVPTFFIYTHGKLIGTILGADLKKINEILKTIISIDEINPLKRKEYIESKIQYLYDERILEKNEKLLLDVNQENIGVC